MVLLNSDDPRWSILILGEGSMCEFRGRKFSTVKGVRGHWYMLRPLALTAKRYGLIRGSTMTSEGFIERWFPESKVFALDNSPVNGRWLCSLDLNGNETPYDLRETYYSNIIDSQGQQLKIVKSENAMLYEKLTKMTSRSNELLKEEIARYKLVLQLRGKISKEKEEDDYKED